MDSDRFDQLSRIFAARSNRRSLFGAVAGSVVAGIVSSFGRRPALAACAPDKIECGGVCVDPLWEKYHCGVCFNTCVAQWGCCAGTCADFYNDPYNCGGCFNACAWDQFCSNGLCECPSGLIDCGGYCADLLTDVNNCGSCGTYCPTECANGFCMITACLEPMTLCGSECVDTRDNVYHCGQCFNYCAGTPGPGQSSIGECIDSICHIVCLPGYTPCDEFHCMDLQTDAENCGACGLVCAHQNGMGICCYGECFDHMTNELHCGECGNGCAPGDVCVNGACTSGGGTVTCPAGQTKCGDTCVNLNTDEKNCGECTIACNADESCIDGVCEQETPESQGGDKWQLWTGKTKLRGAHILQRRTTSADDQGAAGSEPIAPVYTGDDFERLASLGANYVVINHPAIVTPTGPYTLDRTLRSHLDDLIETAAEAGLFSVIAFRTGPGRSERALDETTICQSGGCFPDSDEASPVDLWDDEDAQRGWVTAWSEAAGHYRDHPAVIGYYLMTDPDAAHDDEWESLAQKLIAAIRREDDQTPILLPIPGDAKTGLSQRRSDDPYVIHTVTLYAPERFLLQASADETALTYPGRFNPARDDESGAFDKAWIEAKCEPLTAFEAKREIPVTIGGFGVPRWQPGANDYLDDALTVFERAGLNYAIWAWYPETWPEEIDGFDLTRGPDPDNHDVIDSDLITTLERHWGRNTEYLSAAEATSRRVA